MRLTLFTSALVLCVSAAGQMTGFSKSELVRYTAGNPFVRTADGRPDVPDYWLNQLRRVSVAQVVEILGEHGYNHQFEGGWLHTNPETKLLGRAFTVRFLPHRPDVAKVIESEALAAGLHKSGTQRVIDHVARGDVLVADVMGRIEKGQFGGENLILGLFVQTGVGFVVDGSFRDLDGVAKLGNPVYSRGVHPGVRGDAMLSGLNVPIRIGGVTVMPGDVVYGDRSGVVFIPPRMIPAIAESLGNPSLQDAVDQEVFQ